MKLSKKISNIFLIFAFTTLTLTVASCGQDTPQNQLSYDYANMSSNSVPEISTINEALISNVTEAAAELILKKDEQKQIEEEEKVKESTTQTSQVSNNASTASAQTQTNNVSTNLFSKPSTYTGPATYPSNVKQFTLSLKRDPAFMNKIIFEPSALCFDDKGVLYTVADKLHHSLYTVDMSNPSKGYEIKEDIKMSSKQLLKLRLKKKHKFDFEGLEFFKGSFYAADEGDRKVFKIDRSGNLTNLEIDLNGYMKEKGIRNNVTNSGFEGLTIDPDNEIIYLMKERQESMVIAVDMKTNKVINHYKIALPGTVEPTLTDASFYNGHLYILVRSHRLVIKVNPTNGTVLSVYDYRKTEEDPKYVYRKIPNLESGNDPDGYGVMEGLAVTKDGIFVASDNNMLPLKRNLLNNKPQLFIFNNPEI